ncbi:MAG: Gfo/Idh/MocA family oxidoreductase [Pseudomonadota bacterium]|nr:Gfo/Idh/MocA family oxidoreductase [Pseudomonadota bacterium]
MKPVVWGVISTAKIGVEKVIPGMLRSPDLTVAAIASRDITRARRQAKALGIARAYGSYDELLADPNIEAVYNPLPNDGHVQWTVKAARAGKHVLCEKPMAMNARELSALKPFARKVHLAEAFMVRHHPQWLEVRERLRAGEIGRITHMQVTFHYYNDDRKNIRNQTKTGGGALYDIGCYAIVAGRWFFEAEPRRAVGMADRDPAFKTDRLFSGLLDFGKGRTLAFSVATQSVPFQRVHVFGTAGRIAITIPFNQPQDAATVYLMSDGASLSGLDATRITVPAADQYMLQAEAFGRLIRTAKPNARLLNDATQNMKIIDALFRSEKSGRVQNI